MSAIIYNGENRKETTFKKEQNPEKTENSLQERFSTCTNTSQENVIANS